MEWLSIEGLSMEGLCLIICSPSGFVSGGFKKKRLGEKGTRGERLIDVYLESMGISV